MIRLDMFEETISLIKLDIYLGALKRIRPRSYKVIHDFYGLSGEKKKMATIAKELGVSTGRAYHIRDAALKYIQDNWNKK